MTTCDHDHEPIQFNSPFAALCPLCALRREMNSALAQMEEQAKAAEDRHDEDMYEIKGKLLMAEEAADKLEEDRDAWKAKAEELQKELDK